MINWVLVLTGAIVFLGTIVGNCAVSDHAADPHPETVSSLGNADGTITSVTLQAKSPSVERLLSQTKRLGFVSVIVQLVPSEDFEDTRNFVDAVITDHFGGALNPRPGDGFYRNLRRLEFLPGFSVKLDRGELERLAADPRVRTITENTVMKFTN